MCVTTRSASSCWPKVRNDHTITYPTARQGLTICTGVAVKQQHIRRGRRVKTEGRCPSRAEGTGPMPSARSTRRTEPSYLAAQHGRYGEIKQAAAGRS